MEEQLILSLIQSVITVFTSLAIPEIKEFYKKKKTKNELTSFLEMDNNLLTSIRTAMKNLSDSFVRLDNAQTTTMIQLFLENPTTENIIRHVFTDNMPGSELGKRTNQVKNEFHIIFSNHLRVSGVEVTKELSDNLFDVIYNACCKSLDFFVKKGGLLAHEYESKARFRFMQDNIEGIQKNLTFLITANSLDVKIIKEFEEKYREQVKHQYRKILIPHFDKAPRIDIDKIFIPPNFTPTKTKQKAFSMDDLFSRLNRAVILGDPGSGKSTVSQMICYELSDKYNDRLVSNRRMTPILVVIREYYPEKDKIGVSIVQFIENEVTSKYQFSKNPPNLAFDYLLNNGHCLVIFDGLDELTDSVNRRRIVSDIESFCNLFPSVPVLVTSREVGYEQAPLDPDCFETCYIAPFNDKQVSEYADKWFASDESRTKKENILKAKSFIEESEIVSDLRTNPLMLSLMCTFYRSAGYIPKNRPEVYKKCSEMLLERWDSSRGIKVKNPLSDPRFLLFHLANWIYSNESLQSGVPEKQLIKESCNYLIGRKYDNKEEAENAAKEFLKFCRERVWVFSEVGTTSNDDSLFKFTHRTFLEYFTANDILRKNNSPDELWAFFREKIAARSWDVIAQLSFQIQNEQIEDAGENLLKLLIEDAAQYEEKRWAYLSFGTRCLQFISPSPETTRKLIRDDLKHLLTGWKPTEDITRDVSGQTKRDELVYAILTANPECLANVAETVRQEAVKYISGQDIEVAIIAVEYASLLTEPLSMKMNSGKNELLEFWQPVQDSIITNTKEFIYELAKIDYLTYYAYTRYYSININTLCEWFSYNHLFIETPHKFYTYIVSGTIANRAIFVFINRLYENKSDINTNLLMKYMDITSDIGTILMKCKTPCFRWDIIELSITGTYPWIFSKSNNKYEPVDKVDTFEIDRYAPHSSSVLGLWCLIAVYYEVIYDEQDFTDVLEHSFSYYLRDFSRSIEARMKKSNTGLWKLPLEKYKFNKEQLEFIEKWIEGKISFVTPSKHEK